MSTALITQTKSFLERKTPDLTRWCRGGVQATPLILMALQDLSNNPATREATPQSVYNALLACAVTGLEPGPLKQEAFLVPFKRRLPSGDWITEVKFLVGWRGIVKQATRAGGIRYLRTAVVHQEDHFEIDNGSANVLIHKPRIGTARGPIVGAYALAKLANGETQHEWLDADELAKIQAFAEKKQPSPAWQAWPDEMARKTAARRLGKYLPMDDTYFAAIRIEDAQHAEGGPGEIEILDQLTEGAASAEIGTGGPVAGFAPAALDREPSPASSPAKPKTRADAARKPIDAKATEAKDPPPAAIGPALAAPLSAPASSASLTPCSIAPASSPPPATSRAATTTTAPPSDEDAGQGNERPADHGGDPDFDTAFGAEPPAPPVGGPQIHGWPATLAGYMLWVGACKTKTDLTEHVGPWKTWARDVMKYDPGDKAAGRAPCPEIERMGTAFQARWKELP